MRLITFAEKCKVVFERLYLLLQLTHSVESSEPVFRLENMMLLIILHANQKIVDQPDKQAKTHNNQRGLAKLFPGKRLLKAHYGFRPVVFPSNYSQELGIPHRSLPQLFLVVLQDAIINYSIILNVVRCVLHLEVAAVVFTLRLLFDALRRGCSREHNS